jgi:hypothetical protein
VYDEIEKKLSKLIPAFLKSVKAESSEKETRLAPKGGLTHQVTTFNESGSLFM